MRSVPSTARNAAAPATTTQSGFPHWWRTRPLAAAAGASRRAGWRQGADRRPRVPQRRRIGAVCGCVGGMHAGGEKLRRALTAGALCVALLSVLQLSLVEAAAQQSSAVLHPRDAITARSAGMTVVIAGGSGPDEIHISLSIDGRTYLISSSTPLEAGGGVCSNPAGNPDQLSCRAAAIAAFLFTGGVEPPVSVEFEPHLAQHRRHRAIGPHNLCVGLEVDWRVGAFRQHPRREPPVRSQDQRPDPDAGRSDRSGEQRGKRTASGERGNGDRRAATSHLTLGERGEELQRVMLFVVPSAAVLNGGVGVDDPSQEQTVRATAPFFSLAHPGDFPLKCRARPDVRSVKGSASDFHSFDPHHLGRGRNRTALGGAVELPAHPCTQLRGAGNRVPLTGV
jgi:hypothetical protein